MHLLSPFILVHSLALFYHLADVLVELGKSRQLFKGDVHAPAPIVARIGGNVNPFGINIRIAKRFIH